MHLLRPVLWYCAKRIMKLGPNNNDTMSSVGYDLGDTVKDTSTLQRLSALKDVCVEYTTCTLGLQTDPQIRFNQ